METSEKLLKAWPIVKWLDDARWSIGASGSLIPGPAFASLDSCSQILTHWLCYITDHQRPWEDVWRMGGPIFAEIVQQYKAVKVTKEVLDLLRSFTISREPEKVDRFQSHRQKIAGQGITYTPRFGAHLLSIARTLCILTAFKGNIIYYLSNNTPFILSPSSSSDDSPTRRLVFLLHILSYDEVYNGLVSFHNQREQFADDLEQRYYNIIKLLQTLPSLERVYSIWLPRRFHKRLWASFRDYVKPGSYHERIFANALAEVGANSLLEYLSKERRQVFYSLELPGDSWNTAFNQMLFDNKVNNPQDLRQYYDRLRSAGRLSEELYPEQFDVSFDFAPRMCDRNEVSLCPFIGSLKLKQYCFERSGNGRMCPVTRILCGYENECMPSECPILSGATEDICTGCSFKIT